MKHDTHTWCRRWRVTVMFMVAALILPCASVAHRVAIGRYVTVAAKPQPAQQYLLQQRIDVRFPKNVLTLGHAVRFLLRFSGYRLVNTLSMQSAARTLLCQPLPEVDKTLGPMPLMAGLKTLVGMPFCVLVDPVHRLMSFELKPPYRHVYRVSVSHYPTSPLLS